MDKTTIAVIGATGSQGGGVVEALLKDGRFAVRAITRDPSRYTGEAHEVAKADLSDPDSLKAAFKGAHGVFVVTNFMEGADEIAQGRLAVDAAKAVGVNHFIWSTLPDIGTISNGEFEAPNFTNKASVDEIVRAARFPHTTFVQAPFYFQNLTGLMSPQAQPDGSVGWALPIDPSKQVLHMADIKDLGKVVAGAFLNADRVGDGSYLSVAAGLFSFNDILDEFRWNGHDYTFTEVPKDVFKTLFDGAEIVTESFGYFEEYTYMGPGSDARIALAREVATEGLTPLGEWIEAQDMEAFDE